MTVICSCVFSLEAQKQQMTALDQRSSLAGALSSKAAASKSATTAAKHASSCWALVPAAAAGLGESAAASDARADFLVRTDTGRSRRVRAFAATMSWLSKGWRL